MILSRNNIRAFTSCGRRRVPLRLLVTALLVGAAGCGEEPNTPVAEGDLAELEADGVVYGMENYLETDGVRSGLIRADSAYVYNDSSIVHLFGMDMLLYHEDGRDRARVTAVGGSMNERTEEMVARGDVVVQMAETPERIETPVLHYDPAGNQIWSDTTTVRVMPDGRTTRGTCFRATLELEDVNICNPRGAVGDLPEREGGVAGGRGRGPRARPDSGGVAPSPARSAGGGGG